MESYYDKMLKQMTPDERVEYYKHQLAIGRQQYSKLQAELQAKNTIIEYLKEDRERLRKENTLRINQILEIMSSVAGIKDLIKLPKEETKKEGEEHGYQNEKTRCNALHK